MGETGYKLLGTQVRFTLSTGVNRTFFTGNSGLIPTNSGDTILNYRHVGQNSGPGILPKTTE